MSDRHGYYFEDLAVGMTEAFGKTITDADIVMFSGVSGDTNPLHLDDSFAARTQFGGRIAHGMLTASLLSTIFGTRMPGPGCIYMSQAIRFRAPVRPGDTVLARATVRCLDPERKRATFDCVCTVGEVVVADGEALVKVPSRD
jgi:3-hydroxybutyryl-CoA dehydratase